MLNSNLRAQGFILEYGPDLAQDGVGVAAISSGFVVGLRLYGIDPQRHMTGLWRVGTSGAPQGLDTIHALSGNSFLHGLTPGIGDGLFLAGSIIAQGDHEHDGFVLKYQADGGIAWIARPAVPGNEQYLAVHALADGGAIACGVRESGNGHDALISRFSGDGQLLWSVTEGFELDEEAHDLTVQGGDIIVAGRQMNFGGTSDAWLARLDLDGAVIWTTSWGGVGQETGRAITPLGPGTFMLAGSTDSYGTYDQTEQRIKEHIYLVAFDLNGDSLWTRAIGDTLYDQQALCVATASNGDLLIGGERSTISGMSESCAMRVTGSGDLLWQRTWDLGKEERILSIRALPDGFIATGWAFGELSRQVTLFRRDPDGN
ncbi:MAG: hypothetical protein IPM46_10055 [Flavobacteriales bacterium]|nr:hypothetical protein [Flavobacteriales bacterium]